jgi:hypothetical protein
VTRSLVEEVALATVTKPGVRTAPEGYGTTMTEQPSEIPDEPVDAGVEQETPEAPETPAAPERRPDEDRCGSPARGRPGWAW